MADEGRKADPDRVEEPPAQPILGIFGTADADDVIFFRWRRRSRPNPFLVRPPGKPIRL